MPDSTRKNPTVFISYRWESEDHNNRVFELSERLRKDGNIIAINDQHVGDPSDGWPLWMQTQIETSDKVLMIFTEG